MCLNVLEKKLVLYKNICVKLVSSSEFKIYFLNIFLPCQQSLEYTDCMPCGVVRSPPKKM